MRYTPIAVRIKNTKKKITASILIVFILLLPPYLILFLINLKYFPISFIPSYIERIAINIPKTDRKTPATAIKKNPMLNELRIKLENTITIPAMQKAIPKAKKASIIAIIVGIIIIERVPQIAASHEWAVLLFFIAGLFNIIMVVITPI